MDSPSPRITTEYDCATGETTERELTPEECAELPTESPRPTRSTQLADAIAAGIVAALGGVKVGAPLDASAIADAVTISLDEPRPLTIEPPAE